MKTSGLYRLIDSITQEEMREKLNRAADVKNIVAQMPSAKRLIRIEKPVFTSTLNPHFGVLADDGSADLPSEGTRIGDYNVLFDISREVDGTLWLCRHAENDGPVMVMRIFDTAGERNSQHRSFEAESLILSRLKHPSCVRHIDSGRLDEGLSFWVTDFGNGVPILDFCDHESMSISDRIGLMVGACDVVGAIHKSGFVGLGLSSGDLLAGRDDDGDVELKFVDLRVTVAGAKAAVSFAEAVREDVTALALILLELVTGLSRNACHSELSSNPPLRVSEILKRQCFALPRIARQRQLDPSHHGEIVPAALDAIMAEALGGISSDRFANVAELREALQSVMVSGEVH